MWVTFFTITQEGLSAFLRFARSRSVAPYVVCPFFGSFTDSSAVAVTTHRAGRAAAAVVHIIARHRGFWGRTNEKTGVTHLLARSLARSLSLRLSSSAARARPAHTSDKASLITTSSAAALSLPLSLSSSLSLSLLSGQRNGRTDGRTESDR